MPPFHVMEVMRAAEARVAAGGEVLHLEVGQPSTPAPRAVRDAAARALRDETLGYTTATGLPELRERIAAWHHVTQGVVVDPGRVVVTAGASGGFVLTFITAFEPGDRVLVTAPGYPCYRNALEALGIEAVVVELDPERGYALTPDLLEGHGDAAGLVVASPANPTGTMLDAESLTAVASWCAANDVLLVADEIYHGIHFESAPAPAFGLPCRTVVLNSFSKYFSMTGWRVGWMVVPDALAQSVERAAQNLYICAPVLSQYAACAAFDATEELDGHVRRYAQNRTLLLDGLRRAGLDRHAPADGAFYVYADVSGLGLPSGELCARWLDELGVATTPGIDFDARRGSGTVRFSFAGATEEIVEATQRLATWVAAHGAAGGR